MHLEGFCWSDEFGVGIVTFFEKVRYKYFGHGNRLREWKERIERGIELAALLYL
jgi:hypothetical protein